MAILNRKKRVCVISDDYEKIREYIVGTLHRGCSLYPVKGGYTLKEQTEIEALLTKDEFAALMEFVKENATQAFITAGNVSEVYGKWNHAHGHGVV